MGRDAGSTGWGPGEPPGPPEDPYAEDWSDPDESLTPYWFPGHTLPTDARRMGLTHHVPEGAILDFAGRLDATKPGHRAAAWVLLLVFGLPVLISVLRVATWAL
jgi:hypothetical protein